MANPTPQLKREAGILARPPSGGKWPERGRKMGGFKPSLLDRDSGRRRECGLFRVPV